MVRVRARARVRARVSEGQEARSPPRRRRPPFIPVPLYISLQLPTSPYSSSTSSSTANNGARRAPVAGYLPSSARAERGRYPATGGRVSGGSASSAKRSTLGRCGVDVGEMWGRYGRDMGEIWARYGRGMGEIWARYRGDVGLVRLAQPARVQAGARRVTHLVGVGVGVG